jgi:predicted Zn-dependent protease
LAYIHTTGGFAFGVNLFEKLSSKEPEVASLLARVLIDADEEVKALECAKRAVNSAPSEFTNWERLAQVYLKLEQYEMV